MFLKLPNSDFVPLAWLSKMMLPANYKWCYNIVCPNPWLLHNIYKVHNIHKYPSCLFCRLMHLVIALMRISYGTRLNRQINAYVWFKSIFHLLKYQLWCYVLCEWHLKMLNVKLCQAMLPSFYPQMIVHCHLTGDHTWESTMSTKLYGWACVIPQCIRVISKKHLWLYGKFMSGYFPLLLYLPYDDCVQYICLHDLD